MLPMTLRPPSEISRTISPTVLNTVRFHPGNHLKRESSTVHLRLLYDHLHRKKIESRKRLLHQSCKPRVYRFADKSSDDEEHYGRPQTRRNIDNDSEHASRNRASIDSAETTPNEENDHDTNESSQESLNGSAD
ncbi:hypothetical protein J6590_045034 [Homalodisca vitripennis]|nr:hypothetical protein J6590_045034 [Homalodisca vitripennis]